MGILTVDKALETVSNDLEKKLQDMKKNWVYPDHGPIQISNNSKKSSVDLKNLAVT